MTISALTFDDPKAYQVLKDGNTDRGYNAFWIDPGEELIVVFMTQIMQMGLPAPYPLRRQLRTLIYSSVIE